MFISHVLFLTLLKSFIVILLLISTFKFMITTFFNITMLDAFTLHKCWEVKRIKTKSRWSHKYVTAMTVLKSKSMYFLFIYFPLKLFIS